MRRPWETVKIKILLGYLFLVGIAAFTVWLIYSEILLSTENKTRISKLNNKILHFNTVLTNLYQAEVLERTYSQTGNPVLYMNYERLMDVIYHQLDSLSELSDNPQERFHTDSILKLLDKKRENLKDLVIIKRTGSTDDLYERAMDRFSTNRDSLNALLDVRKTITDKSESIYIELKRKKFFERLRYAFNPKVSGDSALRVNKQQIIQTDSVVSEYSPADSVMEFLSSIMQDIRRENQSTELRLARKESEALTNDRTITLQLRQMLSIFENEILVNSINELENLRDQLRLTTMYLISLGLLALFVIAIFLIMILKDITRSQRYRAELERSKAYSDSLLKSKQQFMLSITHDIKSPISSVTGYARLMKEAENEEQKDRYLENINKSADHILRLIGDLVDLTRLETGKLKIEKMRFNLYRLTKDIFSGFYPMASSKNLEFTLHYDLPKDMDYYSDPVRLKQILWNIISNAVKYTHSGSVIVTVSLNDSDAKSDFLRFDVTDTGIGISEQESKLIFEEFTQIQIDSRDKYEGVGLGLNISQRLVGLLNGNITVESTPGVGSRFTVNIPLERLVTKENIQRTADEPSVIESIIPVKIILIDDDEIFLDLISESLIKANIQVLKCTSAIQAIQLLGEHSADLIVTDVQMPSMNGMELLAYMQRKTGKLIPVIVVSGRDDLGMEDFPGMKIAAFLKKPFLPEVLFDLISSVLQQKLISGNSTTVTKGKQKQKQNSQFYTIEQIKQFAVDDPQSIQNILESFVESSYENLALFDKLLLEKNRKSLSELAHKMLAMFRQLEAEQIVNHLLMLEKERDRLVSDEEWMVLATETKNRIRNFIRVFCKEQGIYIV